MTLSCDRLDSKNVVASDAKDPTLLLCSRSVVFASERGKPQTPAIVRAKGHNHARKLTIGQALMRGKNLERVETFFEQSNVDFSFILTKDSVNLSSLFCKVTKILYKYGLVNELALYKKTRLVRIHSFTGVYGLSDEKTSLLF